MQGSELFVNLSDGDLDRLMSMIAEEKTKRLYFQIKEGHFPSPTNQELDQMTSNRNEAIKSYSNRVKIGLFVSKTILEYHRAELDRISLIREQI